MNSAEGDERHLLAFAQIRRGAGEGLEPLTARLRGGCQPPHLATTSNYGHTAARIDHYSFGELTPFRVTNRVTT